MYNTKRELYQWIDFRLQFDDKPEIWMLDMRTFLKSIDIYGLRLKPYCIQEHCFETYAELIEKAKHDEAWDEFKKHVLLERSHTYND